MTVRVRPPDVDGGGPPSAMRLYAVRASVFAVVGMNLSRHEWVRVASVNVKWNRTDLVGHRGAARVVYQKERA